MIDAAGKSGWLHLQSKSSRICPVRRILNNINDRDLKLPEELIHEKVIPKVRLQCKFDASVQDKTSAAFHGNDTLDVLDNIRGMAIYEAGFGNYVGFKPKLDNSMPEKCNLRTRSLCWSRVLMSRS